LINVRSDDPGGHTDGRSVHQGAVPAMAGPQGHLLKEQTIRSHLDIRVHNDPIRMMWKAD
jgi:hypothetical protein